MQLNRFAALVFTWLFPVALAVSVLLNLRLTFQLQDLRRQLAAPRATAVLAAGTAVPPFKARSIDTAEPVEVRYGDVDVPTVIYVFSPSCGFSNANVKAINELITQAKGRFRFIGLSLATAKPYEQPGAPKLDLPVYITPDAETIRQYRLALTPTTLLVSQEGKVVKQWLGYYGGPNARDIEDTFGVDLPDVTQPRSAAGPTK